MQDICDTAANSAGFRISEIALAGKHELSRENILTLAGITGRSSLLFLDAAQTRARLLTNPWIADATVLKLYPGRLRIGITERQPFALWQKDGEVSLIAADGTVLEHYVPPRFAALPLLVGKGAEQAGQEFLGVVKRYPDIARNVEASVLVAERRWNLHLKSGIEALLPEDEPEHALANLGRSRPRQENLVARHRHDRSALPDRVTVRLSDAAAAARDEALKAAAEKNKKKKGGRGMRLAMRTTLPASLVRGRRWGGVEPQLRRLAGLPPLCLSPNRRSVTPVFDARGERTQEPRAYP